jgi:Sec-independent protein translocase protein TatA
MDINNIIPNSTGDLGAIVFWVIIIILGIIAINLYWYYREMSKKVGSVKENLNKIDKTKKSKEDKLKEHTKLRNKVDQIIEEKNKL